MGWKSGDDLPELATPRIGRLNIAYMAVAMRDPNLVHIEDSYASKSGLPGVIAHGTFVLSYAGIAITRVFGGDPLRRLKVDIIAPVFPNDELRVRCAVSSADTPKGRLEIQITVVNQDGREVGRGNATVHSTLRETL